MKALGRKRLLPLALLGAAALLGLLAQGPAQAGGPLLVGGGPGGFGTAGQPFVWSTTSPVSYHTDRGELGNQTTGEADQLVREAFDVWQNVTTASIAFQRAADLGLDVNGSNHMNFFKNFINDCNPPQPPAPANAVNAIVYDDDGQITSDIFGVGQETMVLGFAGAVCIDPPNTRLTRGRAVLNGLFIDGQPDPDDPFPSDPDKSKRKYKEVAIHEFGHLIGLDHSQVNIQVFDPGGGTADNLFGLPVMFPFLIINTPPRVDQGFPALAPDDEAWISFLYPSSTFTTTFGFIEGEILFSDGVTHVQGGNVIARQVSDGNAANGDESRRNAVSVVSGYKFTGNPGQAVTGTNTGGSIFGSRDPTLIGFYEIPLKPGDYTVEVESIDPEFTEGSSVGPLGRFAGEQFPLPGPPEFWNLSESATDTDPLAPDSVGVSAGSAVSDIDIILNGTPTRFDAFESSARLWLREPAPAWLRRQVPFHHDVPA